MEVCFKSIGERHDLLCATVSCKCSFFVILLVNILILKLSFWLQKRIDGGIFELLDYCLSFAGRNASVIGSETPFAGLEIKRCSAVEECQTDKLNSLIEALVNLIYKIVEADVRLFPDTTIVYWLVLARSIVLNISLASIKDQIAADSSNAGEDKDEGNVTINVSFHKLRFYSQGNLFR